MGSFAPGEACSHDGACKLANDKTDGAKCRNGICVDCNDNDDCRDGKFCHDYKCEKYSEAGEECSHDGACKLANGKTDGAKCRNGKCVDCNDNDGHCGNRDKFCDRDNWKCEDKLKGGTECDGGDQCNCMDCDCNKCKSGTCKRKPGRRRRRGQRTDYGECKRF
jgi:hypothetical protein